MYLADSHQIWIATGQNGQTPIYMLPKMLNRHGLVTGATGTGKTTTIKVLAEALSEMGSAVFMADIKGDVSGLCQPGEPNANVQQRLQSMGISDFSFTGYPVQFFDLYANAGLPVRTTVSSMGPLLLARILDLNDVQAGVLQIVFKYADDQGLLMLDFKDLRAMVQFVGENAAAFSSQYGNVASSSIGAIQRGLLTLELAGADRFFGEPELDLRDWINTDTQGRGVINILNCVQLFQNPLLYSTFLLWMLSELYELLPEVGDLDQPKLVFFFDEAHLLFNDAPKALLQKIEQVVRLIRSKSVGVYFISQSPADIPDSVLSQLGNKIQHALRAYTPNDQKAIKAAAASFRPNPDFDCATVIGQLATGEALVSPLDASGAPQMIQRGFILPPRCRFGPADPVLKDQIIRTSPLFAKYYQTVNRYSAAEALAAAGPQPAAPTVESEPTTQSAPAGAMEAPPATASAAAPQQPSSAPTAPTAPPAPPRQPARSTGRSTAPEAAQPSESEPAANSRKPRSSSRSATPFQKVLNSGLSTIGRTVTNEIIRGIFGTLKK